MTPEQKSPQQIDRQLEQAGWLVQDYRQMNISAGLGIAVREFPPTTGDADYMLYADTKAIGVVEAKPKGHTLTGVETQSGKCLDGLPKGLPSYRLPLPFAYPQFFNEACKALGLPVESVEAIVESSMIRFHYGPWDDRYYHVLAFLEATGLLEVSKAVQRSHVVTIPPNVAVILPEYPPV